MGYYTQEDIPFHWALAQAFTLLDNYHCSVLGPTDPNRAFWQNGTNDPQGLGGGPILETVTPPPLTFESGAETIFNAGYTVKCYLGGGSPGTYPWFANFKSTSVLPPAAAQSDSHERHPVRRRHPRRDRQPGQPHPGVGPEHGLRGGLRQRGAA